MHTREQSNYMISDMTPKTAFGLCAHLDITPALYCVDCTRISQVLALHDVT